MTIARRLTVLLVFPWLVLLGLGALSRLELAEIKARSRFVAETQVGSLVAMGNISRHFSELRVDVRSVLLTQDKGEQAQARAAFDAAKGEVTRLLSQYEDSLISDDRDRRLLNEYRVSSREWITRAENVMSLAAGGRQNDAVALLSGPVAQLGKRLAQASGEWVQYNEELATVAGKAAIQSIEHSQRNMLIAVCAALALSALLGLLTFRRIVHPIRSLQTAVESIAGGDYAKEVPCIQARDETGELARSIDVLKRGAAAMEGQRWVKANAAALTGQLQGATTLAEFGQRLVSGLMPVLGGGVAGFYVFEDRSGSIRRTASYGLAEGEDSPDTFRLGEGLAGQCARDRRCLSLAQLPADFLRISSGLGEAPPVRVVAWPVLAQDRLLGVLEVASLSEFGPKEMTLLEELLPTVALSLEVLQRSLRTQELLDQTQQQAEELRAQQESILEAEARTRQILESAAEGIFGVDTEGRVTFMNPAASGMLGFSAGELIGQPSHATLHHHRSDGADYPMEECPMFAAYKHGRTSRIDDEFLWRNDGTGLPVEYRATPILEDGRILGAVISFTDITERKRAEEELRVAKEKAEAATVAKSAFLANMSHEIRTPMNGVIGMTELALDTELTAEQRDYLNTVKFSADALLTLINDILDFSKIEAGKIELDPVEFLLRDAIADTLNPLALRAASKGLELLYDVQPGVPDALVGDIHRLRQVLVNLVGNAIKFTEQGEVVVSVRRLECAGDDLQLEIAVRDTGIGIPPDKAAKLFRPFEQADAATTRKYGGTGLGLAISRQLVELMGGQIRLESEAGKGSTFVFTTRLRRGTDRPSVHGVEAVRLLTGRPALIVDDNETNRRLLTTILSNWGMRPTAVSSAAQAMAALDRTANAGQPFCLVITDLNMPDVGGFQLTQQIRSSALYRDLPVMVLSSSSSPGDQERCVALGVAARLLKPVKQSLLLDNIMRTVVGISRAGLGAGVQAGDAKPGEARRSLRLLLAEDNLVNQKFAVKLLEGAGHKIVTALNGQAAVDAWRSQPFDLILMDVQMPEMDGLAATQEIRQAENAAETRVPIIAMTANAMQGDRELCIKAGMDGYVAKPVKKDALFAEIDRVLSGAGKGQGDGQHV